MNTRSRAVSLKSVFALIPLFLIILQLFAPLAVFADPIDPATLVQPDPGAAKVCKIVSLKWIAKASVGQENDSHLKGGVHESGWFAVNGTRRVLLEISTQNCAGNSLSISVVQRDADKYKTTQILDYKVPIQSDAMVFSNIAMLAGEEACSPLTKAEVEGPNGQGGFITEMALYLKNHKSEIVQEFANRGTPLGYVKDGNGNLQQIGVDANYQIFINTLSMWAEKVASGQGNNGWELQNTVGQGATYFIPVVGAGFLAVDVYNTVHDWFFGGESAGKGNSIYSNYVETLDKLADDTEDPQMRNFANIIDQTIERENRSGRLIMPAPCDHIAKVKIVDATGAVIVPEQISNRIAYQCSDDSSFDLVGNCGDGTGRGEKWSITGAENSDLSSIINVNSPCYDPNIGTYRLGCVELISPIPGFGNTIPSDLNVGKFINIAVQILIGLIGLAAVVRLVQLGVEYFTTDSINQKFNAKKNIWMLIWAIAIAAGVFVIFNTINPYILQLNFSVGGVSLDTLEGDMGFINDTPTSGSGGGGSKNCPEGTIFSSGFTVCKPYKDNIDGLVAAAKLAGIELTGGGYRSPEGQIAVRKNNCASDPKNPTQYEIYEKPSKRCSPPTAIPGTSMHESGYALDLMCKAPDHGVPTPTLICYDSNNRNCKNRVVPATKYCFDWLNANAGKFGYKNWAAENWHFSSNGH